MNKKIIYDIIPEYDNHYNLSMKQKYNMNIL